MSTPARNPPRMSGDLKASLPSGEPVAHFARSPGKIEIQLKNLDSLFDRTTPPTYPHVGPMVSKGVASFLVDSVREQRGKPTFEITVALDTPRPSVEEEATARAQVSRFFANEAELGGLEQRVNRTEGLGALRYSIPVVLVAGFIAALLYATAATGADLRSLAYVVVVVVVWVALWDPIEILLFDSYFIRLRIRALRKLATAKIGFVYRPGAGRSSGPLSG